MPSVTLKSSKGLLRELVTEAYIYIPSAQGTKSQPLIVKAIWDTGATGSAITQKVAQSLKLIPTGLAQVGTAGGVFTQNTYTIDIGLPSRAIIQGIVATEVPALTSGCDALIGMDIITLGDFSITNHNGITCMSFRLPSQHEIDYAKNPTYGVTPIATSGKGAMAKPPNIFAGASRNQPCPCGSGKKFKHCHGA